MKYLLKIVITEGAYKFLEYEEVLRKGEKLNYLQANAAREGFITDEEISLDRRYAGSANFASELPKRRLRVKAPRNTKSKRATLATNETTEAETAAKTLSSLFQ